MQKREHGLAKLCSCTYEICIVMYTVPDSKVNGANMGPIRVLSAPLGPHGPCYQGYLGRLLSTYNLHNFSYPEYFVFHCGWPGIQLHTISSLMTNMTKWQLDWHGNSQGRLFINIRLPWEQGSWGQHGAHPGPTGPMWVLCGPREPCYLGPY